MNILFLLRLWPVYGGGETVTICLANEMVKRGWNVSVIYFKDNKKESEPIIDEKIKVHRIEGVDCDEFTASSKDAKKVILGLIDFIKSNDIKVIINQWWPVEYIKGIKELCDVKVIKCLHTAFYRLPIDDPNPWRKLAKQLLRPWYVRRTKQKAIQEVISYLPYIDKYVFLSHRFQDDFQKTARFDDTNNQLASIPNPTVFDSAYEIKEYSQKERIVLLVGRMEDPPKKISRAIDIWRRIESDNRFKDWKFVLVGEGRDLPRYKKMAIKYGLKRIIFEGYKQPEPYYRKARIFVMTSDFEGFGMTLLESHQNAVVPVVMDSYLSLHDIVVNNDNGLIVKNKDIDGFTLALKRLMADDKLCYRMACKGLETSQKFKVSKVVDQWERLINELYTTYCSFSIPS